MEVHRTLRVPKTAGPRMRTVRVVGDGTPENTRVLDASGEPIEELVRSYEITGNTQGCARGVFTYFVTDPEGNIRFDSTTQEPIVGSFEAWVVLEGPSELAKAEPAANKIDRLAQFILREMPGEPEGGEGAIDTAIRLLRTWVPVPREGERYWSCKIGPMADDELVDMEDGPMRRALQGVFQILFGRYADELTSGWAAHLTQGERRAKDYFADGTPREVFVGNGTVPLSPEEIDLIEKAAGLDGGTKEGAAPAGTEESGDTAFSRLAPGGIIPRDDRGYKV